MANFSNLYSRYYNLLYQDKDYPGEFQYVQNHIAAFAKIPVKSVLDIGCGTGKTLKLFKDAGYKAAGVDLSENMLAEAKQYLGQENDLLCAKAADFKFKKKFDAIISLFHVLSYQTENGELEKVFANAAQHLAEGGVFLFDFWYGPAVLTDLPAARVKKLENTGLKVTRLTTPVMRYNDNIVEVNFDLTIEDKRTGQIQRLQETHNMRYLFWPEIKYWAEKAGLSPLAAYRWLTTEPLSEKSWYGFVVLRKQA